jgi:hypothetical protein
MVATRGRRAPVALAFALAGLASAWSPLAATFAAVTCLGASVLAWRARRGERPRLAGLALAVALLGLAVSARTVVRALRGGEERAVATPAGPAAGPTDRQLDDAAAATRPERERAAGELERLPKPASSN